MTFVRARIAGNRGHSLGMMEGGYGDERPGQCSSRRPDYGSGIVELERDVGGRRRGDVEKECKGGGGRGRAGIFNLVVNILLALVVCPQSSSLAFCSRPPSGGGSAPASLSMTSSSSMIRKRPALLATVGSGTPNLGGGLRGNAVCTTRTGGHSRCVAGGASCKHWEGLSCAGTHTQAHMDRHSNQARRRANDQHAFALNQSHSCKHPDYVGARLQIPFLLGRSANQ